METAQVLKQADQLHFYANHFAAPEWRYTRNHDIKHIRYQGDWSGYFNPVKRLLRVPKEWARAVEGDRFVWRCYPGRISTFRGLVIATQVALRTEHHRPDGVLGAGHIITHWEEDGEYIQQVQPSVGILLAEWLQAEPQNPHAQRIAEELQRIADDYRQRLEAKESA